MGNLYFSGMIFRDHSNGGWPATAHALLCRGAERFGPRALAKDGRSVQRAESAVRVGRPARPRGESRQAPRAIRVTESTAPLTVLMLSRGRLRLRDASVRRGACDKAKSRRIALCAAEEVATQTGDECRRDGRVPRVALTKCCPHLRLLASPSRTYGGALDSSAGRQPSISASKAST